ncbi:MAG TPA: hypothetical protein VK911_05175 [Vicinamibacterales bacterium]|nr:hypothetical protein [Vicinamibacterales bacterium]
MKNSPTFVKRQREKARRERQEQKAAKRLEASARKAATPRDADGEDPDIAGIRLGPQPPQED